MLAFPGDDAGKHALQAFVPAKSGKCWFRTLFTREQAIACKRELIAAGIRYTCRKVDRPQPRFAAHQAKSQGGVGGRLNTTPIDWR